MSDPAKVTNIKTGGFTVSWFTDAPEVGYINYGPTPSLGSAAHDDRGGGAAYDTHHITIAGLTPGMLYYYDIVSGAAEDNNGGAHYTVTTAPDIAPNPGSDMAFGQVYMPDGATASGSIVYIQLEDNDGLGSSGLSQEGSSVCDAGGWWWFDLSNLRNFNLNAYFRYSAGGDNEILSARAGRNTPAAMTIDTLADAPAPDMMLGWVLNLNVPWCRKELHSSAASCQTILNYIREGAQASLLTQGMIYAYGHPYNLAENSAMPDMDPDGIDAVLGHFDPYDTRDPAGRGDAYYGYNFDVEVWAPDRINEYMRDIVHWMAYPVTKGYCRLDGELAARPNTPAAIPLYGSYDHWVVATGAAVSNDPVPYPRTNPWFTPDFTVSGFWLTDPAIEGIGQHAYVTADECRDTYFKPLVTSDKYNGLFVQVSEPPPFPSSAEIALAPPREVDPETGRVGDNASSGGAFAGLLYCDAASAAGPVSPAVKKAAAKKKDKRPWWVRYNWRDIIDPLLFADPGFKEAFDNTKASEPVLVRRPDDPSLDYYLVSFAKKHKPARNITCVVIVDALRKYFKSATWTDRPARYLPVSENIARKLVMKDLIMTRSLRKGLKYLTYLRLIGRSKAELTWKPNGHSNSPFAPYWRISVLDKVWYVTQGGKVITELSASK
jgi:hypothetical protein